jgi:hypothetical protein
VKHRFLRQVGIALAVAAVAVPLAHATNAYDGYKSSYPQLHQLTSNTTAGDDGLKSSYPQLHQLTSNTTAGDDGLKSSYPQLHSVLAHQVRAPLVPTASSGFDWRDAAIGAGTAAGAIFLLAGGALLFSRRHTRLAT